MANEHDIGLVTAAEFEEHEADSSHITSAERSAWNAKAGGVELASHKNAAVLDHPDESVNTDKIADGAVTNRKLDIALSGQIASAYNGMTANMHRILELESGKVSTSAIGQANGVAGLDANGRVPSAQLPSYVDDVLEGSMTENGFVISGESSPCEPESGKIYVDTTTQICYRWGGSAYVEISPSLALGETSSTAYAGHKGKQNADDIGLLKTRMTSAEEAVEEITDVTTQQSRNLYDPSDTDAEVGKKFTSTKTGDTTDASGYVITGYIDVHENHGKYLTHSDKTISTGNIASPVAIYAVCIYDQNKEIVQKTTVFNISSYTIPDDAYYVRANINVGTTTASNHLHQLSVTEDNLETVVEEYAPPETVIRVKTSAIPGYAALASDVQGLTVGGSKTYGFALGGLANDGITPSASTNRAHSEWIYCKGLTEITAPTGYTVKAAYCFDEAFSLIGTGTATNGNAQLLDGTVWVRITVADAEDTSKDLTDDVADITATVSGADIALGRYLADGEYLPKTLPVNPEWENWQNERYSWGFNKNSDQPFIEADAPFEANMISVKGGKGRWHTQGTPTHTPSPSAFVDGGHLFEGWNADETLRLTMLIGKYDYKMACIQCYGTPELNQGQRVYGYIKVGSDNANFGVNFGEKSAKFFVPILLSTTRPTEVTAMYETGDVTTVPVGAMYYDTTADRVKVMTANGWKSLALEV